MTLESIKGKWQRLLLVGGGLLAIFAIGTLHSASLSALAAPQINGVAPSVVSRGGGDTITITGDNFEAGSQVSISGTLAQNTTFVDVHTLTAIVPAGTAGPKDVVVTNSDGQLVKSLMSLRYKEIAPTISSVTQSHGPASQAQNVKISGTNFATGIKEASSVAMGTDFACGALDGASYCWGNNNYGVYGNGTRTNSTTPTPTDATGVLRGKKIISMAAGNSSVCALSSDNGLFCWGNNNTYGQLGDGTTTTLYTPVAVKMDGALAGKTIKQISVGNYYACALTTDGGVYCWGYNNYGQLGNGTTNNSSVPVAVNTAGVLAGKTVTSISAGETNTCAVTSDGSAACWGYNNYGQLGNGTTNNSSVPVAVSTSGVLAGKALVDIASGTVHTCAVSMDGKGYCWGNNNTSQLGDGTKNASTTPVAVDMSGTLAGKSLRKVIAGGLSTCVLATDGWMYCWGYNFYGQLGNGTTNSLTTVTAVKSSATSLAGKNIFMASMSANTACAMATDATLSCWGSNTTSQVGDGTTKNASAPVAVVNTLFQNAAVQVQFGGVVADSAIINSSTEIQTNTPPQPAGSVDVQMTQYDGQSATLAGGYTYDAAPTLSSVIPSSGIRTGGDTITLRGQNFTPATTVWFGVVQATNISFIDSSTIVAVTPTGYAGLQSVRVINSDGQAGTLSGGFTYTEPQFSITSIVPTKGPANGGQSLTINGQNITNGTKSATKLSAGSGLAYSNLDVYCGVYSGSAVYCQGANTNGQLGDGTKKNSATPVAINTDGVLSGKTILDISVGSSASCAIASDGKGYCWGYNTYGQIGDGTKNTAAAPVAVDTSSALNGKTLTSISVGGTFTCATANDGKAYCWGYNTYGQLGDGTKTNTVSPVAVATSGVLAGKTLVKIAAGDTTVCALSSDNQVYCWGNGTGGQLGNGAKNSSSTALPVTMPGGFAGKAITDLSLGSAHACMGVSDGSAYCWGDGSNYQVGNGSFSGSTTPLRITAPSDAIKTISANLTHTCVITTNNQIYCWGNTVWGGFNHGSSTAMLINTSSVLAQGELPIEISSGGDRTYFRTTLGREYVIDGAYTSITAVTPAGVRQPSVTIGGTAATNVLVNSPTQLQLTTPSHTSGIVGVTATSYDTQSSSLPASYEYVLGPTVTNISPTSGLTSGGDTVTITGSSFVDGDTVRFGLLNATNVTVVSSTTITATVPTTDTPGAVDIVVADQFGQSSTLTKGFMYKVPNPVITSITPGVVQSGIDTVLTIKGDNFSSKVTYSVAISPYVVTNVTVIDSQTIQLTLKAPNRGGVSDVTISSAVTDSATLQKGVTVVANKYQFTNAPLSISSGQSGALTIRSVDQNGSTITSTTDTLIKLSSTSSNGKFARNLSEDVSTRWSYDSVILPAGQSSVTVWYQDTTPGAPTITASVGEGLVTTTQKETITSQYRFLVSGVSDPITAGIPSSVTVRVVDYNGDPQSGYTGTIHFSSSDTGAIVPVDYPMTATDRGIKTFTNGVILKTPGEFCITATDTNDTIITGSQCNISVRTANSGTIDKLAIITAPQFVPINTSSTPITIQTQDKNGVPIPVSVDTPIYLSSTSSSTTFSPDASQWSGGATYTATIPAGATSVNIYAKDSSTATSTISARDLSTDTADGGTAGDQGWTNATQSFTSGVGAANHLAIDGDATLLIGAKGTYVVSLQDATGKVVTALNDVPISLQTSTSTARLYAAGDTTGVVQTLSTVIPQGSTSITINVSDTTVSAGMTMTRVTTHDTRSGGALTDGTFDIQIINAPLASATLQPGSSSVEAGVATPVTLSLFDSNGTPTYASTDTAFRLNSSSAQGQYSLTQMPFTPITSVVMARGEGTRTLYYRNTTAGTDKLNVTAQNIASPQSTLTVTSSATYRFGLNPSSESAGLNQPSKPFTVTAYDVYGNIALQTSDTPVYLYTDQPTITFASAVNGPWSATSVIIPTGQSTVQFYAKGSAFNDTAAQLTASDASSLDVPDAGVVNGTASFRIISQSVATISFTTAAQTLTAGSVSNGITINLKQTDGSPAIQDGTTSVAISANEGKLVLTKDANADGVTSVPIAKGDSSVSFYYSGQKAGVYAINAQLSDAAAQQAVTVQTGPAKALSFTSAQQSIPTHQASAPLRIQVKDTYGNVTNVAQDTTLSLSSTCGDGQFSETPAPWAQTQSITIMAGASDATFYYKGITPGTCTLSVSSAGLDTATQPIELTENTVSNLLLQGPSAIIAGEDTFFTVSLADAFGNIIPASNAVDATLTTSSPGGTFSSTALHFDAGTTTQTVRYNDKTVGSTTLTVQDNAHFLQSATSNVTIQTGTPSKVSLTPSSASIRAGEKTSLSAGIMNEFGVPITVTSDTVVTLSANDTSGVFYGADMQPTNQVTIPANALPGNFFYSQTKSTTSTITASANTMASGAASVTVVPSTVKDIRFKNSSYTSGNELEIGQAGNFEVSLVDEFGNATSMANAVTLYAQSTATGTFSNNGAFTIAAGQTSGHFTYTQLTPGAFTITVDDTKNGNGAVFSPISQQGSVIYGKPAKAHIIENSLALERGGVSEPLHVELLNSSGQAIPGPKGGQVISLAMADGTGVFSLTPNGTFAPTANISFAEGELSHTFYYRNDDAAIEDRRCTTNSQGVRSCETTHTYRHVITAFGTFSGTVGGSDTLTVNMYYGTPTQLVFVTPPRQQQAQRATSPITVERQNQYGKAVPMHQDMPLTVRTSSDTGTIGSSKIKWSVRTITILDSDTSASFYYKDSEPGQPTLSVEPAVATPGLIGDSQPVTITEASTPPPPPTQLIVTNISDPQMQGTPSSVIVIAVDQDGFIVDSYNGTVRFSSDDPAAYLPDAYTFNPTTDKGAKTFTNKVAFTSPGEKTVTATDANGITGSQTDITVLGAPGNAVKSLQFTAPQPSVSLKKGASLNDATVQLFDAAGNPTVAPSGGLTIHFTTSSAGGAYTAGAAQDWQPQRSITIPAGLGFATVNYRDTQVGQSVLTATDWQNEIDSLLIDNATLAVAVTDDTSSPTDPETPSVNPPGNTGGGAGTKPTVPSQTSSTDASTSSDLTPPTDTNTSHPPSIIQNPSKPSVNTSMNTSTPFTAQIVTFAISTGLAVVLLLRESVREVLAVRHFKSLLQQHHLSNETIERVPLLRRITKSVVRSVFFWAPIGLSVVLSAATVWLLQSAAQGEVLNSTAVITSIVAIAVGLVCFFGARVLYVAHEEQLLDRFFRRSHL